MNSSGFVNVLRLGPLGVIPVSRIICEQRKVESEYHEVYELYEKAKGRISQLEGEKDNLSQQLSQATEELRSIREAIKGSSARLLNLPSATDIMAAFNRMCPDERRDWFFNPREDPNTGAITLSHNFAFYPFSEINIPRGKLRLCNQYGMPVCLAQCEGYASLPSKYAQHHVPTGHRPFKLRVLFVNKDDDANLWLSEPRTAQDILLEIWTHYEGRSDEAYEEDIKSWEDKYHGTAGYIGRQETIFKLIISIEEFLCEEGNNFSKDQIERIRKKCYAEYLDLYFHDDIVDEG